MNRFELFRRRMKQPLRTSLLAYRVTHGLSQNELARQAGVSRMTIQRIEGNYNDPSVSLALRLAEVFSVTVHDLFRINKETRCDIPAHRHLPRT